jgi:hypothetical protein
VCLCPICCSRHNAIKSSLSSGNSASAAETLIDWIDHAKLYLSKDQQVLGDMDTVSQLIDQHQVITYYF